MAKPLPAFIVRTPDGSKSIAIYADGRVDGQEHIPGFTCVINRIPVIERAAAQKALNDVASAIAR